MYRGAAHRLDYAICLPDLSQVPRLE
jgi:hypothetical protein